MNLIPYCRLDDIVPGKKVNGRGHPPTVYLLINERTGEIYVGRTSVHVTTRMRQHARLLTHGKHHSHGLQNAVNFYGLGAFYVVLVAVTDTIDAAIEMEQQFIDVVGTKYNNCPTARSCKGRKMKESVRRSIMARSGRVYCKNNNTWYDSVSIAIEEHGVEVVGTPCYIRAMLKKHKVFEATNGLVLTTDPEYLEKVLTEWGSVHNFASHKYGEREQGSDLVTVYDYDSDSIIAHCPLWKVGDYAGAGISVCRSKIEREGFATLTRFACYGELDRNEARRRIEEVRRNKVAVRGKSVGKFNVATGELIEVYGSEREASRSMSTCSAVIRKAIKSKTKHSNGFLWARMSGLPDGCTRIEVPPQSSRKIFKRAAHEGSPIVRCEETGKEYCHFADAARDIFGNADCRMSVRCAALAKRKYKGYTFTLLGELANGSV